MIKKADFGGMKSALVPLRLFEDPVPKHDEYHQGNSENDHGSKFL